MIPRLSKFFDEMGTNYGKVAVVCSVLLIGTCTASLMTDEYACWEAEQYMDDIDSCIAVKFCNITLQQMNEYERQTIRAELYCKED